jgi:GDP-L-fucose synthase
MATEKYDSDVHLNIGTGEDLTIKDLAHLVASLAGFKGQTLWDATKPDGTPRKVMDVSRLKAMGWNPTISLEDGIQETIRWFEANYN